MIYAGYDQTALDAQYNPESTVASLAPYNEMLERESERARARFTAERDVAYGPHPDEVLDIFPSGKSAAATLVYFHGGFWRRRTKNEYNYVAAGFVPRGHNVVVVNYSLIPVMTLPQIVEQSERALAWVLRHARDFGGDPERVVPAGNSAGGHLVTMMPGVDWAHYGLPPGIISRVASISGLHDLEPVRLSYANSWVGLDEQSARHNSPLHRLPAHPTRLVAAVGSLETDEFKRQTQLLASAYRERGNVVTELVVPDRHHFSITHDLVDPASPLTAAIAEHLLAH